MKNFFVYILQCSDNSYYVGQTSNLDERTLLHSNSGLHSYVAQRLPAKLVFVEEFASRNDAFERERQLKGWSRRKKEALIQQKFEQLPLLSKKKF